MTQAYNLSQLANKVNTSGQLDVATGVTGTQAVANGGTGQSTYTDGQLLIGNSTGNTLTKATITAGSGISVTNGAGAITIAASGGGGFSNMQVFVSPGTFTTPASTTKIKVTVVGGGGGGGSPGGTGGTGGTSSFGPLVSATGGSGGGSPPSQTGGSGGAGSAGTLLFSGGNGTPSTAIGGDSFLGGITRAQTSGVSYGGGAGGYSGGGGGGGGGGTAIYVGPVTASTPYSVTVGSGGPPSFAPLAGAGAAGVVVVEY